jgi:hypothetical protein
MNYPAPREMTVEHWEALAAHITMFVVEGRTLPGARRTGAPEEEA